MKPLHFLHQLHKSENDTLSIQIVRLSPLPRFWVHSAPQFPILQGPARVHVGLPILLASPYCGAIIHLSSHQVSSDIISPQGHRLVV